MKKFLLIAMLALSLTGCDSLIKNFGSDAKNTNRPEQVPQVIAANETAALARLRSIVTAEMAYALNGDGQFATLETLIASGAMSDPARGKLTGYRFEVRVRPGGFEATAIPERYGVTGKRSFYVDESRQIHGADKGGAQASNADPDV
ncbi:MAG: hypothetical protein AB1757_00740 [Acidobacteriota bacterium]